MKANRNSDPVPLPASLRPKTPPVPKAGVIRTAQKKAFRKSNNLEVEQRTEAAYLLLSQRRTFGQIKATFEKEYNLAYRQTAEYITRARKRIAEESGKTREQHALDCLNTFISLIRDPRSSSSDKINANTGIVKMLGLSMPATVEIGAVGGAAGSFQAQPLIIKLTMDPREITG